MAFKNCYERCVHTPIHKEEFKSILFDIKNDTKLLQFIRFSVVQKNLLNISI